MTEFVFALQGVVATAPGFQASDRTIGKVLHARRRVLTGTC